MTTTTTSKSNISEALDTFIENMKNNVPGFMAISVTDIKSGVAYGSLSVVQSFDPDLASAYNLEVVKAKLNAIEALGLKGKEFIKDITITLDKQIHIIDVNDTGGGYFIYLAVDSEKINLGMTKALLNKYKNDLSPLNDSLR